MPIDKNILKKKIKGVPVPVIALGAGVVGVIVFRKFGPKGDGAAADGAASAADYSGGTAGAGGSASDYSGGTGEYGSGADLGGGGGGDYVIGGGGGGFLPATVAFAPPQTIMNAQKWSPTWKPTWKPTWTPTFRPVRSPGRGGRPTVINKTVINIGGIPFKRHPDKVFHDRPINLRPQMRNAQNVRSGRKRDPYRTPPIIKRGKLPRSGGR